MSSSNQNRRTRKPEERGFVSPGALQIDRQWEIDRFLEIGLYRVKGNIVIYHSF